MLPMRNELVKLDWFLYAKCKENSKSTELIDGK